MIQCKCCMHQVQEGSAVCDICKFPLLASSGIDMEAVAEQFRRQRFSGCSISVKLHYYEPDEFGELIEQKSEYAAVAQVLSLSYHEILWADYEFNPPDVDRVIELEVRLGKDGAFVEKKLTAKPEKLMKCAGLGLYLDEGLTVRFAVGTRESYILSDAVSLLEAEARV